MGHVQGVLLFSLILSVLKVIVRGELFDLKQQHDQRQNKDI